MKEIFVAMFFIVIAKCSQFIALQPDTVLTTTQYKCIKDGGYNRISIQVQSTPNGIEQQSVKNLVNANNAGLQIQIYITPCRARSASSQAQLIIKNLGTLFETIWIYPSQGDEACSWYEYPAEFNCMYLQQFVNQMKKNKKKVGIVGQRSSWTESFESPQGCTQVDDLNLLWVPQGSQIDHQPNFNSYKQLGGWQKPYAKLYNTKQLCGQKLNLVYYI